MMCNGKRKSRKIIKRKDEFQRRDAVRLLLEYTPPIKPREDTAKSSGLKPEETRNQQWNIQKSSPQS